MITYFKQSSPHRLRLPGMRLSTLKNENTYIAGGLEHRVRLYQWSYLGLLFLAIDYDQKLRNSTLAVVTVRRIRSTGAIGVVEPRT